MKIITWIKKFDKEMELQYMANKYFLGDKLDDPFFREMVTLWVRIKKVTGKDPHEWLKNFDKETYKGTGAIGWIDALSAIEAVAKGYENRKEEKSNTQP